MPTVLPTVGHRAPTKDLGVGPLRHTAGNTVGKTTPFSACHPIKFVQRHPIKFVRLFSS